jgi:hypothetical protein
MHCGDGQLAALSGHHVLYAGSLHQAFTAQFVFRVQEDEDESDVVAPACEVEGVVAAVVLDLKLEVVV